MLELKEIGLRVASLRETCGLTATEMAAKLEISEDNYIAFEHGEYDFAISTLNNIALILGVDILDIISGESPRLSTCTVVKKDKGFVVNRNPGYEFQHLAYTFKSKKAEPFLVKIDPSGNPPVMDEHEGQEFDYVISGSLLLYIGDICYELNEGDSAYFDSSIPHAHKNVGDTQAEFIALVLK